MRCAALLLGVLFATPLVGCSKKTARNTGGADVTPDVTPAPKAGDAKKETPEKPTWLDTKPKDGQLPVNPTDGDGPWVQNPPAVGKGAPPPAPAGGGGIGQPGGTTVPPKGKEQPPVVPPPVGKLPPTGNTGGSGKIVTRADMNEVWIFAENFSLASGKMPRPELIIAALAKEKAAAAELVKSGDIILTGATKRESVWAFERKAPTQGGWVAGQNGPEEVTAAEFAKRIKE